MFDRIFYFLRHWFPIGFYKIETCKLTIVELVMVQSWINENCIKGELYKVGGDSIDAGEMWKAMNPTTPYTYNFTFWHSEDAMAFKLRWT